MFIQWKHREGQNGKPFKGNNQGLWWNGGNGNGNVGVVYGFDVRGKGNERKSFNSNNRNPCSCSRIELWCANRFASGVQIMKTKIISSAITLAILVWTGTLFFSRVTLFITIGLVGGYALLSTIWILYQLIAEQVELSLWRKELKRRGFK